VTVISSRNSVSARLTRSFKDAHLCSQDAVVEEQELRTARQHAASQLTPDAKKFGSRFRPAGVHSAHVSVAVQLPASWKAVGLGTSVRSLAA